MHYLVTIYQLHPFRGAAWRFFIDKQGFFSYDNPVYEDWNEWNAYNQTLGAQSFLLAKRDKEREES